jgi:hypothetical protein
MSVIPSGHMAFTLNYGSMLFLDTEDLAEAWIKKAYDSLARDLARYISPPAEVQEIVDNDAPSYVVRCGDQGYVIQRPSIRGMASITTNPGRRGR